MKNPQLYGLEIILMLILNLSSVLKADVRIGIQEDSRFL